MPRGGRAKYAFLSPPPSMEFSCVCVFYSEDDICLPRREDNSADHFLKKKKKKRTFQITKKNLQVFEKEKLNARRTLSENKVK